MESSKYYLEELNDQQKEAVTYSIDDPLFINAGAGSGKTRTLICRIAYLISCGAEPKTILAITFTKKAAEEIKLRLDNLIGPEAKEVTSCTFHQLCLNILKQNPFILGFKNNFSIADYQEQIKIINKGICSILKPSKDMISKLTREFYNKISFYKGRLEIPENDEDENFRKIFDYYQSSLKSKSLIDFNDFIYFTLHLFRSKPIVAFSYYNLFQYILVDEFQDTSRANFEIIKHILKPGGIASQISLNRKVTIVGDPNQSIYSFRGANLSNIDMFNELYKNAKTVYLTVNYRSTEHIVKLSQRLLIQDSRLMTPSIRGGVLPTIFECFNPYREAEHVCKVIQELVYPGSKIQYKDIVILFRLRRISSNIEMSFFRSGIPYSYKSGRNIFFKKEVKELLSVFKLILHVDDIGDENGLISGCFQTLSEFLSIDPKKMKAFTQECMKENPFKVLQNMSDGKRKLKIQKDVASTLTQFYKKIRRLSMKLEMNSISLDSFITIVIDELKFVDKMEEIEGDDVKEENDNEIDSSISRADIFNAIIDESKIFYFRYKTSETKDSLPAREYFIKFLNYFALEAQTINSSNQVTLSTIHRMKGLEYSVVFLIGCNDTVIPMSDSNKEEEKRIMYVAITRPKQYLFISYCLYDRDHTSLKQSPFLSLIVDKASFVNTCTKYERMATDL